MHVYLYICECVCRCDALSDIIGMCVSAYMDYIAIRCISNLFIGVVQSSVCVAQCIPVCLSRWCSAATDIYAYIHISVYSSLTTVSIIPGSSSIEISQGEIPGQFRIRPVVQAVLRCQLRRPRVRPDGGQRRRSRGGNRSPYFSREAQRRQFAEAEFRCSTTRIGPECIGETDSGYRESVLFDVAHN